MLLTFEIAFSTFALESKLIFVSSLTKVDKERYQLLVNQSIVNELTNINLDSNAMGES
jgi:hypothetical protein